MPKSLEEALTSEKALIFRATHRLNLPWALANGLHSRSSDLQDPNFVAIGNAEIIYRRQSRKVPIAPGGNLADYVPFYFTPGGTTTILGSSSAIKPKPWLTGAFRWKRWWASLVILKRYDTRSRQRLLPPESASRSSPDRTGTSDDPLHPRQPARRRGRSSGEHGQYRGHHGQGHRADV